MCEEKKCPAAGGPAGGEGTSGGDVLQPHYSENSRNQQVISLSRATPVEALAMVSRAGAWLTADGDELTLGGSADPPPALAAALERNRAALLRYVAAFPGGRWPGGGA